MGPPTKGFRDYLGGNKWLLIMFKKRRIHFIHFAFWKTHSVVVGNDNLVTVLIAVSHPLSLAVMEILHPHLLL